MASLPPNSPPGPPGGPPTDTVKMGPPPGAPRRRIARPLVITGVIAIVVGAGAGVAAAVTGASSPSAAPATSAASAANPAASPTPPPGEGGRFPHIKMGGPFGAFGGLGAPFGAVHGQFVVPKSGGGYQTVDTQRGSVTAVSSTSITIKSGDGFVKSYAVTSDTIVDAKRDGIGSIKTGDQAFVMATVSGSTATATNITDISNLRQLAPKFFGGPPPSPGTG